MSTLTAVKVCDSYTREQALRVMEAVFLKEKKWIDRVEDQFPEEMLFSSRYSWFLAKVNGQPAGLLRLFYDPPLVLPEEFEVTLNEDVDLEKMAKECRFVEVGRFMILPVYRRNFRVALRLMRIATKEVVERDYTHFITDVYENETHSPFRFHTKVLGFEVIGKHLYGELKCNCTRLILTLDILKAYKRLKRRRHVIYQNLLKDILPIMEKKIKGEAATL
jgi:hypothetical protein